MHNLYKLRGGRRTHALWRVQPTSHDGVGCLLNTDGVCYL